MLAEPFRKPARKLRITAGILDGGNPQLTQGTPVKPGQVGEDTVRDARKQGKP